MPGRRRYDFEDHERFDRPRRRTRPRTKDRPTYDDAITAMVVTVDRGRYTCLVEDDGEDRLVTAMKSRPLGRKGVVVGDRVRLVGDVSGDEGSLARIVEVEERRTVLRRTADDDDPVERVIVANADQLVVVAALADPEPRPRLIDGHSSRRTTPARAPAVPDQARPRGPGDAAGGVPPARGALRRDREGPELADIRERLEDQRADRTAASASPPWSTGWSPARTARSGSSTRSRAAAGTPRPRR